MQPLDPTCQGLKNCSINPNPKSNHNTNIYPLCYQHVVYAQTAQDTKLSFAFVDVNVLGTAVQSLICARVVEGEMIRF